MVLIIDMNKSLSLIIVRKANYFQVWESPFFIFPIRALRLPVNLCLKLMAKILYYTTLNKQIYIYLAPYKQYT